MVSRQLSLAIGSSKKSALLLGPRQVGKSTLLKSMQPDLIIDLASEREYFRHSSDPELLESILDAEKPKLVLIDEIQRLPSLTNSVQYWIDSGHRTRFLLSGSSARKLKKGQANLAPGRFLTYRMGGLSAAELGYKLDVKKALRLGTLPEPYFEQDSSAAMRLLRDYAATYLREEIQAEAFTRNIQGFSRFLNVIAESSGQLVDFSKAASRSKISRTTSIRFVEMLEDTLVAERVHSFQGIEEADVIKHPKLFFFDTGVLNGLLGGFDVSADRIGRLFEHLVFNQMRNSLFSDDEMGEISFFRTRHGLEVDFIVKIRGVLWAIEAKAGAISSQDLSGLLAFKEYYGKNCRLAAVSLSEPQKRLKSGCLICGLNDLLREMRL